MDLLGARMPRFGYHASHEQFTPSSLLQWVRAAASAGFTAASCSDHFHPWSAAQGQSGFAWSWLGAAMQATRLPFSVVCAPGQRYHPAIVAQAVATLAELFPRRFTLTVGSGEALNEHITGERWPPKEQRNARLKECVDIMRALWAGETVTHHGLVTVEEAKLYTLPVEVPRVIGAAVTAETARWLGSWADGLITVARPREQLRPVLDAFRENGGASKPVFLKVQLSYAVTDAAARQGAWEQWRVNIFDSPVLTDLTMPHHFESLARHIRPDELDPHVRISADLARHVEWLRQDVELGCEVIGLHNVNREQERFIHDFGARVLPELAGADAG
jgi:probable non-F420 flavinoid oxidoreductase